MDQPTIDGLNTWFVSKAARELGLKVAISGLGGDELLGGYPSFRQIPWLVRSLRRFPTALPLVGRGVRGLVSMLDRSMFGLGPKSAGLLEFGGSWAGAYMLRRGLYMPWEITRLMDPDLAREGLRRLAPEQHIAGVLSPRPATAFARVSTLESALYMRNQLLRDTDWASMAHSLEVRVPLVDAELLRRTSRRLPRAGAVNGKDLLATRPSVPLPDSVRRRVKTGFITPIADWMQHVTQGPAASVRQSMSRPRVHWSRQWARSVVAS